MAHRWSLEDKAATQQHILLFVGKRNNKCTVYQYKWPITNRVWKEWHDCNGEVHIEEVMSSLNMCTDEVAAHFVLHATTHSSDTRVTEIWTMLLEGTGFI